MRCPNCGHENSASARFCGECGRSLAQATRCAGRGRENPPDQRYCNGCGASLPPGPPAGREPGPEPTPLPASFGSGRYRVARLLGRGAKKRVYLARDTRLDRDVAVSVFEGEGLDRAHLRREADALARLGDHPNSVTLYEVIEFSDMEGFIGLNVIKAGRIAAKAQAGGILVSSLLKELTRSIGDVRFGASRDVTLKGISEPEPLFVVEWQ